MYISLSLLTPAVISPWQQQREQQQQQQLGGQQQQYDQHDSQSGRSSSKSSTYSTSAEAGICAAEEAPGAGPAATGRSGRCHRVGHPAVEFPLRRSRRRRCWGIGQHTTAVAAGGEWAAQLHGLLIGFGIGIGRIIVYIKREVGVCCLWTCCVSKCEC